MSQDARLIAEHQQYVQEFNQLCLTAAQEQDNAVAGESERLKDLIDRCRLSQSAIRELATMYDEPVRGHLERIAEFGMAVAERPRGGTGRHFFEEVQAACRALGCEAGPRNV